MRKTNPISMPSIFATISQATVALKQGAVIAYPTEAVFGLGCDPDNNQAIETLLDLKQRSADKGLIIIASAVEQLDAYVDSLSDQQWQTAQDTWPGPVTWLMPARTSVAKLLTGRHATIAVRVTQHPVARALCEHFGKPIVSTSANRTDQPSALTAADIVEQFGQQINCIVDGVVDLKSAPSEIRDLLSGKIIRGH